MISQIFIKLYQSRFFVVLVNFNFKSMSKTHMYVKIIFPKHKTRLEIPSFFIESLMKKGD